MAEIRTEEKQVTLITRVFLCEFTQEELDALCNALKSSVTRYHSAVTPGMRRMQRTIKDQLMALSDPVKPIEEDDEEEEDNA